MKILLVEDDATLRLAMQHLIPRWGHDLETAENGAKALTMVENYKFDGILLDEQLPDVNGRMLAPQLRGRSRSDPIFIIGLTGFVDPDERQSFFDAGMDEIIQKPIRKEVFDEIIARLGRSSS